MPSPLLAHFGRRVLVFDGAMGTAIHGFDLTVEGDFDGCENCSEILNRTRPDVVESIHASFLEAGVDAVETNTFGGASHVLGEFDRAHEARDINRTAAEIARAACDRFTTDDKPRFVIGSMGPGTKLLTLGQMDWDDMHASYLEQVRGLLDGGVDAFLVETAQDLLQVKCAINACLDGLAERKLGHEDVPIMVQVTIETTGTMLLGSEIAAAAAAVAPFPVLSLGLNCATGPTEMAEHLGWLSANWSRPISVLPNAGLPELVDGQTVFPLRPVPFANQLIEYIERFGLAVVGGCCGTTPAHLERLVEGVGSRLVPGRAVTARKPACSSLYTPVEYRQDSTILNIGERTNASGSRKFKRLLEEEKWDDMVTLAREMLREGSHLIDINVDYAGRDNAADMADLVRRVVRQVDAPIMLDSTQPATIEAGLKRVGGKCVINSANFEDGEEKFDLLCGLARRYGAAIVLGCIDEDEEEAMARTAERKLEIASRMHDRATTVHGIDPSDLFFDPLVLPISTGLEQDRRSGLETVEGTRRISEKFPGCQITCGLSNVSFGLKPAARVVLNSVFLSELVKAGMTSAILHVTKIVSEQRVDPAQWQAALDLIYDRRPEEPVTLTDGSTTDDPLQIFVDLFGDGEAIAEEERETLASLPLEERLRRHIIDGERQGLTDALDEALGEWDPIAIINNHLLDGMRVVGELFGAGRMQLPFVLQSAEVMKAAVAHLEPHMDKLSGVSKGSIVLATVKGDVHDIGKNLVDIILSNNGYTVHNIGIKQPINAIIEALEETDADAVGLSGLLVKSVTVMEENLGELNTRGIDVPVLLGGAALSRHYAEGYLRSQYEGSLYYGRDAFDGLRIMDHLVTGRAEMLDDEIAERIEKRAEVEQRVAAARESRTASGGAPTAVAAPARSEVRQDIAVPTVPFFGERLETVDLETVFPYINPVALFRGQWQFKKGALTDEEFDVLMRDEVEPIFERLCTECRDTELLNPQVVYGYWPCQSDGDDLIIYDAEDHEREIERFSFPRQPGRKRLCIADFFKSVESGEMDVCAFQCVTVGNRVSDKTRALFETNEYAEYLYLHGFGVECAEATAEYWHQHVRREMGIADEDASEIRKLFTQGYRGSRYSAGYPACPEMSDQEKVFRLLKPERIGCTLTENWQIDPEQSTSAIVVHHPQARYFSAL